MSLIKALATSDNGLVRLMLESGSSPNELEDGIAAMHVAAGMRCATSLNAMELLLQFGGDTNVRTDDGATPVHVAVIWNRAKMLRLLLSRGGDTHLREYENGWNAYDFAIRFVRQHCLQLLTEFASLSSLSREHSSVHGPSAPNHHPRTCSPQHHYLESRANDSSSSSVFECTSLMSRLTVLLSSSTSTLSCHLPEVDCPVSQDKEQMSAITLQLHNSSDSIKDDTGSSTLAQNILPAVCSFQDGSQIPQTSHAKIAREFKSQSAPSPVPATSVQPCLFSDERTSALNNVSGTGEQLLLNDQLKTLGQYSLDNPERSSCGGTELPACKYTRPVQAVASEPATLAFRRYPPTKDATVGNIYNDLSHCDGDSFHTCVNGSLGRSLQNLHSQCGPKLQLQQEDHHNFSTGCDMLSEDDLSSAEFTSDESLSVLVTADRLPTDCTRYSIKCNYFPALNLRGSDGNSTNAQCFVSTALGGKTAKTLLPKSANRHLPNVGDEPYAASHLPLVKPELEQLTDAELRRRLIEAGDYPGPILPTTKSLYLLRLAKLMANPELATPSHHTSNGFSPELLRVINGTDLLEDIDEWEATIINDFEQVRPWREGNAKDAFTYLLLDARLTGNLPLRARTMNHQETFEAFLSAVFYVGKGKKSRPYHHLVEAAKGQKVSSKSSTYRPYGRLDSE